MSDEKAILVIQCAFRVNLARKCFRKKLEGRYEKIYDPRREKFYYYDRQLRRSTWKKPVLVAYVGDLGIAPTYTEEQAAIMIQRQVRRRLAWKETLAYYVQVHAPFSFGFLS